MSACRLILDPAHPGPWNMAVDEVLLQWSAEQGGMAWRFYGWDEPTISLGYFQSHADRAEHPASRDCPMVRRQTGGGAIVHDRELTYSVVVPDGHPLATHRDTLYRTVHACLIDVLGDFGAAASLCSNPGKERPFLCFQRRSPGDVLLGDWKIGGSAQRRRRGAVLQHGSVLLRRSAAAPELPGVEDLHGRPIDADELSEAWLDRLAKRLAMAWEPAALSSEEADQAQGLVDSRYGCAAWTRKQSRQNATPPT